MSNISELKSRLEAIKQTRQITGAMYLLSTSRMKKSIQNADFNITYLYKLRETMKDIIEKTKYNGLYNRFIEKQGEGVTLYIAITSDKGLCGSYNSDIVNKTVNLLKEREDSILLSIGSQGNQMFKNRGVTPDYNWSDVLSHPTLNMANEIAATLISLFRKHEVNEAYVVFTEYKNSSVQTPVCQRILPVLRRDFDDIKSDYKYTSFPIYEPSVDEVFDLMIPQYVAGFMYDVFMQSAASENSARMRAMQNATDNADEMIQNLSAKINAERQLAITNEILEISAATDISGAV
ncbi:MAG: ATP synthase F1 subunit gamma [Clostridia bacterium]|nr:ATP synthase F1 subunit gamma [Clostridia bacterium]